MKPYFVKTPVFVSKIYNKRLWRFDNKEKNIYLTFDDGPTPSVTEWALELLEKFNAQATFFCIGENVKNYPELFQKILSGGHSIGNHTYNHLNGWKVKNSDYFKNIEKADHLIGQKSKLFRPPYGKMTNSQANYLRKKIGYNIVMWDVLSADFDSSINVDDCHQNVIQNTKNGSIIVFHDSIKAEKKLRFVLPKILEYYSALGFKFRKIE